MSFHTVVGLFFLITFATQFKFNTTSEKLKSDLVPFWNGSPISVAYTAIRDLFQKQELTFSI